MTQTSKAPAQRFTALAPDAPEGTDEVSVNSIREITYATWGRNRKSLDGAAVQITEWVHLGWTSATDVKKAMAAGRSSNKYFAQYMITPAATAAARDIDEQRRAIEQSSGGAVWGER